MNDILQKISKIKSTGQSAVLCIIVNTKGSSPGKTGAKMIVYPNGSIEGTVGGGRLEFEVIKKAKESLEKRMPLKVNFKLDSDLGMSCGGYAEVYIEPILPDLQLYIFGAGHIGKALSKYAPDFGFQVSLIDPRENIDEGKLFGHPLLIREDYAKAAAHLELNQNCYVVIVTPQHKNDEEVLEVIGNKPRAYLGMIGSKSKIAKVRKRFVDEKLLAAEILDTIDMPIGIKFNAQTPEEIAVSILAKMIDVKNSNL